MKLTRAAGWRGGGDCLLRCSRHDPPPPGGRHPRACPEDPFPTHVILGLVPRTSIRKGHERNWHPPLPSQLIVEVPGTSPGMTAWGKRRPPSGKGTEGFGTLHLSMPGCKIFQVARTRNMFSLATGKIDQVLELIIFNQP